MKNKEKKKIDPFLTATAVVLQEEAKHRQEMLLKMAQALLTGKIDSQVIRYAEMIVDIAKKERVLLK